MSAHQFNRPMHWFLLRGLTREARHWGAFPSILQRTFPQASLQMIDLPGAGDQYQNRSPWRMGLIAEDVRRRAQFPRDGRPCYILAISMGAMVATEWLKEHPTGLHGAVFMNTSLSLFSPFWERLRPQQYATLLRIATSGSVEERERLTLRMITGLSPIEPLLPEWTRWAEERPVSLRNALAQVVAASGYAGSLEPPPRPLLVLRSLGDRLVNPKASERIAKAWHVPLFTHPSAGHDLPIDDPHWVCEQILRFLTRDRSLAGS